MNLLITSLQLSQFFFQAFNIYDAGKTVHRPVNQNLCNGYTRRIDSRRAFFTNRSQTEGDANSQFRFLSDVRTTDGKGSVCAYNWCHALVKTSPSTLQELQEVFGPQQIPTISLKAQLNDPTTTITGTEC